MRAKTSFGYVLQQAWLLATFPLLALFFLGITLLTLEVQAQELWFAAAAFCALSPLLAWFLACQAFPFPTSPQASTSLLRYADRIARFEARTGSTILGGIALGFAAFFASIFSTKVPTLHTVFAAIIMLAFAAATAALTWREFSLLRYFAAGRKAKIDQQRLEVWYEAALAEQRRALRSTLQRVTIQNYCAVRQGICSKTVAYQGIKSSFAAYAFAPEIIPRRIVEIRDHLHKRGHTVMLPTDDNLAQVLICKLCQVILSCQHLVAEVSEPNPNVYFEYGLALGHGKKSWLIAIGDLSPAHPLRHPLLRDTITIRRAQFAGEEIAADIDRDALSLSSTAQPTADRMISARQLEALPEPSSTSVVVVGPHNVSTALSSPDVYADVAATIAATIESEGFTSADPFEPSTQHTAGRILQALASARAVIAILAADTLPDHHCTNALICFLAGYALAKERPLLIFQITPSGKELIDLAGIIRFADDHTQFTTLWNSLYPRLFHADIATEVLPPVG